MSSVSTQHSDMPANKIEKYLLSNKIKKMYYLAKVKKTNVIIFWVLKDKS